MVRESEAIRTHVILPRQLVREIDEVVGRRGRSKFLAEAVAGHLARLKRARLAEEFGGSLADVCVPGWENRESTEAWVRGLRASDRDEDEGGTAGR
jgi:hypothetical protein